MYSRFVLAGPGNQAVRQLAFASNGQRRQGRVVEGKGRQQKMEAEGKKNPIYISEVANVPCCASYSRRE